MLPQDLPKPHPLVAKWGVFYCAMSPIQSPLARHFDRVVDPLAQSPTERIDVTRALKANLSPNAVAPNAAVNSKIQTETQQTQH